MNSHIPKQTHRPTDRQALSLSIPLTHMHRDHPSGILTKTHAHILLTHRAHTHTAGYRSTDLRRAGERGGGGRRGGFPWPHRHALTETLSKGPGQCGAQSGPLHTNPDSASGYGHRLNGPNGLFPHCISKTALPQNLLNSPPHGMC